MGCECYAVEGRNSGALPGHMDVAHCCAVTANDRHIVSSGDDSTLKLWVVSNGDQQAFLLVPGLLLCSAIHPRLLHIVFGDIMKGVFLADLVAIVAKPKGAAP